MLAILRGKSGELRAGYQQAAQLGRWTARRDADGGWTVEAKPEHIHNYWIAYDSLEALLQVGTVRWRWRSVEILDRDAMLFRVTGESEKGR